MAVLNMAIYENLNLQSVSTLIKICRDVYGDRVWYNMSKRVIKDMSKEDLVMIAFKIQNKKFILGAPFMPDPIIPIVSTKIIPKDHNNDYLYMGMLSHKDNSGGIDLIPLIVRSKNAADLNRKVSNIVSRLQNIITPDEKKSEIRVMKELYDTTIIAINKIKAANKLNIKENRDLWLHKVIIDTQKWLDTCATRAYDYAKTETYQVNMKNKYNKLLNILS